ncbi:TPA: hypothetical protein HA235_04300 [Candidatus Woesearchaeota archaeon]|nr:hypothetical protein [uncultured archaeon]MBS3173006.1 hypothetical protein [Candidatus Woesearchaeota archaeon]AQS32914.1 hypothetical protein [uncultured archaeon]AQS34605.1 hypothetical protein [uncultured archaeon]HIH31904.1 hypothetical protein [Candidatus Woesearchaeota archaeon]
MVSLTLSIPEELKARMDQHSEINWSEVARKAIMQRLEDFEFMKRIREKSTMTEKDAIELGRMIKRSTAKRYNDFK